MTDAVTVPFTRAEVLPEARLPSTAELTERGRARAREVTVGPSLFLAEHGVASESEYKRRCMERGRVMLHGQVGFRDPEKTGDAYASIYERLQGSGCTVDRYGICLDWSMGYPRAERRDRPRGTGLILEDEEDFASLTGRAPVAAHFGDFVMGTPAAVENTAAALRAGSTAIGNLGQYFTFRLPHWDDDVATTAATIEAIALVAAQPCEVLVHSNLDDGFAAVFCDLACALGAVVLECNVVERLLGARLAHCYGHTYSGRAREVFHGALARVTQTPGTMIYGNTTSYGVDEARNYDVLADYLGRDYFGQRAHPTGHALNPVPVTEAKRIPDTDEIVDAHVHANRLFERLAERSPSETEEDADRVDAIVAGGHSFADRVFAGLGEAGIDTEDAFELLISLRRIGARRLEELFGPGELAASEVRGRRPIFAAPGLASISTAIADEIEHVEPQTADTIRTRGLAVCIASTDVHEYGKLLVEGVLQRLGVRVSDAGVSTDPETLARAARAAGVDAIAVSTYNGVALDYLRRLRAASERLGLDVPVYIGGKLNQVPDDGSGSLPVDVAGDLTDAGAIVCHAVGDMLEHLADVSLGRGGPLA